MSFPLFLARRFRTANANQSHRRSSAPAVFVATFGVAVGLAVMLIAVAVSKGFQQEVKDKISGFGSHIEILDMSSFQSPEDFPVAASEPLLDSPTCVTIGTRRRLSRRGSLAATGKSSGD